MFASMHEPDCPIVQTCLCLLDVRDMYGGYLLMIGVTI